MGTPLLTRSTICPSVTCRKTHHPPQPKVKSSGDEGDAVIGQGDARWGERARTRSTAPVTAVMHWYSRARRVAASAAASALCKLSAPFPAASAPDNARICAHSGGRASSGAHHALVYSRERGGSQPEQGQKGGEKGKSNSPRSRFRVARLGASVISPCTPATIYAIERESVAEGFGRGSSLGFELR